ncbi:nucleolus and neural progenitor protein [Acipenser ruthenus]|uniref:nucleolus and neural progenitor protein n=1 Tax=Acipenser ruthenus TaxID=7906 RepID=UPI002741842A|nr:nucleolus and neural progenitor protein [Acipenser ruthenus]
MATALWNRVEIAYPGTRSTLNIKISDTTEICIERLLKSCESVLTLLRSKVLKIEIEVLYSLLYVFHNRLRQHKPYQALKQVEQCVKRLNGMKLETVIQDLKEMCPKRLENSPNFENVTREVPSQPVLEWLSLKIMGGCKLALCFMENCSKVFLLTIQHLYWEEYIVLNVVLTGMLSRLWVLFRGILKNLAALYEEMFLLLQEVSGIQQMPFVKEFTFPSDMKSFLGPSYIEIVNMKLPKAPAIKSAKSKGAAKMLDALFASEAGYSSERRELVKPASKGKKSTTKGKKSLDVWCPVIERHPDDFGTLSGLDVKALCRRPQGSSKVVTSQSKLSLKKAVLPQKKGLIRKKKSFVSQIKGTQSFSDLTEALEEMVDWCRGKKLKSETMQLGYKLLKCRRLKYMEALGCSLHRKLNCFRRAVCKSLLRGGRCIPFQSTLKWTRFVTIRHQFDMKLNRFPVGQRTTRRRVQSKEYAQHPVFVQSVQNMNVSSQSPRTTVIQQTVKETSSGIGVPKNSVEEDAAADIDSIFAAIGL